MKFLFRFTIAVVMIAAIAPLAFAADTISLFNGKDLTNFYTFLKDRGKNVDPKGVFSVKDGAIHITGEEWGCITSNDEFSDYELTVEFKWGEKAWANREKAARDSGVLVHSTGADGAYSGIWMHSIEVQMIEGGTGDLLVVGDNSDNFAITCETADDPAGKPHIYKKGGKPSTIHGGRIDWWGRDLGWTDTRGFRGKQDVEKPVGEWNTIHVTAKGDMLAVELNGVVVNEASGVKPSKGRIQVQSEGAELYVRKIELTPLK